MQWSADLELPFVKAPYENLSRVFRNAQKQTEKEINQVVNLISDLHGKKEQVSREEACETLGKLVGKLQGLKRKLEDSKKDEDECLQRCKARIDHLSHAADLDMRQVSGAQQRLWYRTAVDRLLVDYLLREGRYDTAIGLARASSLDRLVDLDIFLQAKKVTDSLKAGSCKEGLKWCQDNAVKLKKLESSLEFNLRMQEFIELVRQGQFTEAIVYARKFLGPAAAAGNNLPEVQRAMAALAFMKDTTCARYKELFAMDQWTALIRQFQAENYRVFSLSPKAPLLVALQAGLGVLKTSHCSDDDSSNINCPLCTPHARVLAKDLPLAHHTHSTLVCRISGELMNEDNPPLVLPNGYAYSFKSLLEMSEKNNGRVTCPRTKQTFKFEDLKKAFIL